MKIGQQWVVLPCFWPIFRVFGRFWPKILISNEYDFMPSLEKPAKSLLDGDFETIFADLRPFLPDFASIPCIFLQDEDQIGACS